MSLILICGDRFNGGRELAQSLAEHLGCRLLALDVVIERAAAWGGSHEKLERILTEPPGWLDRFLSRTRTQVLLLRAAAAEEIRSGNAVCYGDLAELLLREDIPMIRVQISVPVEARIGAVCRLLKYSEAEAAVHLKRVDRARKEWLRLVYGLEQASPTPDLVINPDRIGFSAACDTVTAFVRRVAEACHGSDEVLLGNLALSSRVSAALAADPATAHLRLSVESALSRIAVNGSLREATDLDELNRVVRSVPGVSEVSLNGEDLRDARLRQMIASHGRLAWRGARPAFVALGLTLVVVLLFYALAGRFLSFVERAAFFRWGNNPVTIMGVVTDSRCGARHSQAESAQCIRDCVARGAKYMLYDGKSQYELSDAQGAGRYAAREVRVRGVLEKGARYLKVESIEPL